MYANANNITSMMLRRRASAAPDPILALFASGEQGSWYDPSDSSTSFTDVSKTTSAGSDDAVRNEADKSGNSHDITTPNTANAPLRETSGGLWWHSGDGVDDWLTASSLPAGQNTLFVAVACRIVSGTDNLPAIIARADNIGDKNFALRLNTSNEVEFLRYKSNDTTSWERTALAGQDNLNVDDVVALELDGGVGSLKSIRTGASVAISSGTTGDMDTISTLQLFRYLQDGSFIRYTQGRIYGAVYAHGSYPADTIKAVTDHLADLAGVTPA